MNRTYYRIFGLYIWARLRNIYMVSCPTTISGKGLDEFEREKNFSDYIPRLIKLYSKIYIWAIGTNLIPLEKFKRDRVSLYPGCHICNQIAAGFFLNLLKCVEVSLSRSATKTSG